MRKGFTLLELIVVIIILGVLATLGLGQYGRMIERSRGAEGKALLGDIRKYATGYYMEYGTLSAITSVSLSIGTAMDQIPGTCRTSHYFSYTFGTPAVSTLSSTATRCTTGGKVPTGTSAGTLVLSTDMSTGVDIWSGTGGY
jgi:prepilin-type N-terminal cleavage/methylation domain-containing protein